MVGADQKQLLGDYLSVMSQNVNSALLKSHKHQYKVAQGPRHIIETEGEGDILTWNQINISLPDIQEQEDNPFDGRTVGISKKVQEKEALKKSQWWTGSKKCPGCGDGFSKKLSVTNCAECSLFVHKRKTCLQKTGEGSLKCAKCQPTLKTTTTKEKGEQFNCEVCKVKFMKKFNLKRHQESKHEGRWEAEESLIENGNTTDPEVNIKQIPKLEAVLKNASLENFLENFEKEGISVEDLFEMNEEDMKEIMTGLRIIRLGDRFRLLNSIRRLKEHQLPDQELDKKRIKESQKHSPLEESHLLD